MSKQILCLILCIVFTLNIWSCKSNQALCDHLDFNCDYECDFCGSEMNEIDSNTCQHRDKDDDAKCDKCRDDFEDGREITSLDGKKIIFIGNSYTYYGQTILVKEQKYLRQDQRVNDKGYFYQLCHANGEKVNVTNWTFGGHFLSDLFSGNCAANRGCDGTDHKSYITDREYDYVVIQPTYYELKGESSTEYIDMIMEFFRVGNQNTKFIILVPYSLYGSISHDPGKIDIKTLNGLKDYANKGVTIVDWGGLVMDIVDGKVTVPGSNLDYNKNTFVISKSPIDGYHPNMLSGYITTLMTYCAITGSSPNDQPYDFCNNSSLNPTSKDYLYSFDGFIEKYYTYKGATTNFPKVFASNTDMDSIQALIAAHLDAKAYLNYNYSGGSAD